MVDRIAEIREALASFARHEPELPKTRLKTVLSAARAYADLLDSDALIIRRDENGEWPEPVVRLWAIKDGQNILVSTTVRAIAAALASSQGVEP